MFGSLRSVFTSPRHGSSSSSSSSARSKYERDITALRNLGISNDKIRDIFTQFAKNKTQGINLERPGESSDGSPELLRTDATTEEIFESIVDCAVHHTSKRLTGEIRPKMRVSAFEDTFVVVFESWIKKQARRSRINWKTRFLRLRAHGPTFVLSYYKTNTEGDNYIQQVPLALGVQIKASLKTRQIECALDNGDEYQVLLRFKAKNDPTWFHWYTHLKAVTMLMESESSAQAMRMRGGGGGGGHRGGSHSVWGRDLLLQERRQREAAAQNAALEKRLMELKNELSNGATSKHLEKLREESAILQREKTRMEEEAAKLKDEVKRLREADEQGSKLQDDIERLKKALEASQQGASPSNVGGSESDVRRQLEKAKRQLREMQLRMLSGGGDEATEARSLLYRALHRFQIDGYISDDVDLADLEKRYKALFVDDDWARLPIDKKIFDGLFRKNCADPERLRAICDAINTIMRENRIRRMDFDRLAFWKQLFSNRNFCTKGPREILEWGRQRIKPWPVRMAGQSVVDLSECCIVGPPPEALPEKSKKDIMLDDLLRVEATFAGQYEKLKAMHKTLLIQLDLMAGLEKDFVGAYEHLPKGFKRSRVWASELCRTAGKSMTRSIRKLENAKMLATTPSVESMQNATKDDDDDDDDSSEDDEDVDEDRPSVRELAKYRKYVQMLKMHLPVGAAAGRMRQDGLSDAEIQAFIDDAPLPAEKTTKKEKTPPRAKFVALTEKEKAPKTRKTPKSARSKAGGSGSSSTTKKKRKMPKKRRKSSFDKRLEDKLKKALGGGGSVTSSPSTKTSPSPAKSVDNATVASLTNLKRVIERERRRSSVLSEKSLPGPPPTTSPGTANALSPSILVSARNAANRRRMSSEAVDLIGPPSSPAPPSSKGGGDFHSPFIKEYRRKKMTSRGDIVKKERVLKGGHGTHRHGHPNCVNCITSTKTYVITGGGDGKAVVWERGGKGKIVRTLEGHRDWVFCLDTTPCEKYVVTGSWDSTLILWKLSNGNRERSFVGHTSVVYAVAVTPSGDGIVSGSYDKTAILWNIHDSSRLLTFKGHVGGVYGVVVSSSGLYLYTCSKDKTAIKWSMKTGKRLDTFKGHENCVRSCCLTSDDKYLLTASLDNTAIVWNADDTTQLRMLKGHSKWVNCICVFSDTHTIATGSSDSTIILWDFDTAKRMCTLKDHGSDGVSSVHISKDNRHLLTASGDGTAIQYLLKNKTARFALLHCLRTIHEQEVNAPRDTGHSHSLFIKEYRRKKMTSRDYMVKKERVLKEAHGMDPFIDAPTPNSVNCVTSTKIYVITGGGDSNAVVWERGGAGTIVRTLEGHTSIVLCLDTTPCEKYVVTGSWDKTLILWKLSNGNRERSFVGHTRAVEAVAVTPSGDGIVSGSGDMTAILWNIHDSSRLLTFKGHNGGVWGVVVSSSGLHLYTCSEDKTAIKWSMKTGERLDTFRGHEGEVISCCLTSDDKYLLTASEDKTAIVWNAGDTTRLRTLRGHSSYVRSVSVFSDTRVIAIGSSDNTVILWDFHTAKPMCTLRDHSCGVNAVHFSKDNLHLFTASSDGTAIQYDISKLFKDIPARFALLHCLRTVRERTSAASASAGRPQKNTKKRKRSESSRKERNNSNLRLSVSSHRAYRTFDDYHSIRHLACCFTQYI
eukprot:g2920.t1